MGRANPATCEHPATKRATSPSYGHTLCTRCDTDLTPSTRLFEWRAGPRTVFKQGDRVHVAGTQLMPSYKGVFHFAVVDAVGAVCYCIAEKQVYKDGEGKSARTVEGTAAIRWPDPELVRHDDGVRNRRAREEELGKNASADA